MYLIWVSSMYVCGSMHSRVNLILCLCDVCMLVWQACRGNGGASGGGATQAQAEQTIDGLLCDRRGLKSHKKIGHQKGDYTRYEGKISMRV